MVKYYKDDIVRNEPQFIDTFIKESPINTAYTIQTKPIRWASGGAIVILNIKNKKYLHGFFRDIYPKGINCCNGASENKEEFFDIEKMITREFSEEFILINKKIIKGKHLQQYILKDSKTEKSIINKTFNDEFKKLKQKLDGVPYWKQPKIKEYTIYNTNYSVKVIYNNKQKELENIIFSANPIEFGIEVVKIIEIDYNDDDYIIDGELLGNSLLRRPSMLIELDFLKNLFIETNSLGEYISKTDSKVLPKIPRESYKIYNADIVFKKDSKEKFDINWLKDYEKLFENEDINNNEVNYLRTLTPVMWRSLEIAFRDNIL